MGIVPIGGRAHLARRGPRGRIALGQEMQGHPRPGGDHQAQGLAVGLDVVGLDLRLYRLPGLVAVGDDDAPRARHPAVLGLFGLQLAGQGVLHPHVPQIGALVAVDAHAVLEPEVVTLQPGQGLRQVAIAAHLAHRTVDGVMQHDLPHVGRRLADARPPAALDLVGELVIAQLALQVVDIGDHLVDL